MAARAGCTATYECNSDAVASQMCRGRPAGVWPRTAAPLEHAPASAAGGRTAALAAAGRTAPHELHLGGAQRLAPTCILRRHHFSFRQTRDDAAVVADEVRM